MRCFSYARGVQEMHPYIILRWRQPLYYQWCHKNNKLHFKKYSNPGEACFLGPGNLAPSQNCMPFSGGSASDKQLLEWREWTRDNCNMYVNCLPDAHAFEHSALSWRHCLRRLMESQVQPYLEVGQ